MLLYWRSHSVGVPLRETLHPLPEHCQIKFTDFYVFPLWLRAWNKLISVQVPFNLTFLNTGVHQSNSWIQHVWTWVLLMQSSVARPVIGWTVAVWIFGANLLKLMALNVVLDLAWHRNRMKFGTELSLVTSK